MFVLPRFFLSLKVIVKTLSWYFQRFTVKSDFSFYKAIFGQQRDIFHSFVFPDLQWLAAKKADASFKNSFSSFNRLTSFSRSFSCLRSSSFSAANVSPVCGVCSPGPRSSLPIFALCTHPLSVLHGIPSSSAAFFLCHFYCLHFKFLVVTSRFSHFWHLPFLLFYFISLLVMCQVLLYNISYRTVPRAEPYSRNFIG